VSESGARRLDEKRRRLAAALAAGRLPQRARSRPIGRRPPGSEPPPLSFAQQRLWFLDRLVPNSPFYNVPIATRIRAPLDTAVLSRTFDEVVRRHAVLRTTFAEAAGRPVQVVGPAFHLPFEVVDLRGLDEITRQSEVVRLATADAQRPFDLSRDVLLRASVLWLGADSHVVLVNLHHIVADGWSMGVLVKELQVIYSAYLRGAPSPLPELEIQYADFAWWQNRCLTDGQLQPQLEFWMSRLANLPMLNMPTEFMRPPVQGFEGETLHVALPASLVSKARNSSQAQGTTLFVTLLAAFNALLHRYTGQDDIVVGEPVAGRNRLELEALIGFFVNSLVLRTDVSGDPDFAELLRRTRQVVLDADANQDLPFEVLVERLRPERTMGRNPLFQVSFQYFTGTTAGAPAPARLETIHVDKGTASLDLAFDLIDAPEGILARIEYSTELYSRRYIERMAGHYMNLLEAFVDNAALRLSRAPMLGADEVRLLTHERVRPAEQADFVHLVEAVERVIRDHPDRVAVDCDGHTLTYAQLGERVRALAAVLEEHDVQAETIVALSLGRSIEMILGVLAVWRLGAAYMPLDPNLPEERARFLLDDARPRIVLANRIQSARLRAAGHECLCWEDITFDAAPGPAGAVRGGPENLAYVIYTSGSTGVPKGVMVEHGAISRHLRWMQTEFPLRADDCVPMKYAVGFDVSILEMICPLLAGARIVVLSEDGPTDIAALAAMIRNRHVTALDCVPSMLAALLEQPAFRDSQHLRRVICGGEPMPAELLSRLLSQMTVEFANLYGPTEATISATFWRAERGNPVDLVPIGWPGTPYTARVVDRHLNLLPAGLPGELCLGGECLGRGYLGQPVLTEEKFVHVPQAAGGAVRLYRTGDRCRILEDGTIEFLGRVDDQVKIRGYRIELGDVETAMATSSVVRSCAVVLRQDRGQAELAAYVVPALGAPEFWPSVGEYFIYDELLYHAMTADRVRIRAYRAAIERSVRGKTVVDVGTGADLALARLCVEAGARRVYAIEMLDDAYRRACRLIEDAALGDRIVLLRGDSREISLPEGVDVCVSELIGTIGSSEGVIDILNDARRFLRPGGEMIPQRCVTRIAAVSLPDELQRAPAFSEIPRHYAERIFASLGRRFDIRLCAKNLPARSIVSEAAVFEDLHFGGIVPREASNDIELMVDRDCRVDGLLAWVTLFVGPEQVIDVLGSECSWLPVFLPVFGEPVVMRAGETIKAVCSRTLEPGTMTPDYIVRGQISVKANPRRFAYESRRDESRCGHTALYRAMAQPPVAPARAFVDPRVDAWRSIYEQLYGTGAGARERDFDIVGWNSSYSGEPLAAQEMREQVDATVERIARLGAARVLEIGCGTGLLLLRLAGHCQRYVGSDFAAQALEPLGQTVQERGWEHVELWQRAADDFSGIEPASFDAVVLNSVVQYFPDIDYLVAVLRGAMRAVGPQGAVFIGDVRHLGLLRLLHAGIELARGAASTSVGELRERIARRLHQEQELVVEPAFFEAMGQELEACGGITIELKRGHHDNELTRFRYDAVLWGRDRVRACPAVRQEPWSAIGSPQALRERLGERLPLAVRGMPSARLVKAWRELEAIERAEAALPVSRLELTGGLEGIEPEAIWGLAEALQYDIQLSGAASGEPQSVDLLCVPREPGAGATWWSWDTASAQTRPWSSYANAVSPLGTPERLTEALRQHLRAKLPEYMIPTRFVWIDALPLTANGKLDRQALPAPSQTARQANTVATPPETPLQSQIEAVWTEVLGISGFGIDANFFNVGGHSLMAIQVVSRLGDLFDVDIALRLMFERPTIRAFSEAVAELRAMGAGRRLAQPVLPAGPRQKPQLDITGLSDAEVDAMLGRLLGDDLGQDGR